MIARRAPHSRTLFTDNEALVEVTRILVREGFVVLPYTSDDPVVPQARGRARGGRDDRRSST